MLLKYIKKQNSNRNAGHQTEVLTENKQRKISQSRHHQPNTDVNTELL